MSECFRSMLRSAGFTINWPPRTGSGTLFYYQRPKEIFGQCSLFKISKENRWFATFLKTSSSIAKKTREAKDPYSACSVINWPPESGSLIVLTVPRIRIIFTVPELCTLAVSLMPKIRHSWRPEIPLLKEHCQEIFCFRFFFMEKFEIVLRELSGSGEIIHEKTWSKKSLDTVPF
jgi:hypothetical protein